MALEWWSALHHRWQQVVGRELGRELHTQPSTATRTPCVSNVLAAMNYAWRRGRRMLCAWAKMTSPGEELSRSGDVAFISAAGVCRRFEQPKEPGNNFKATVWQANKKAFIAQI